MEKYIKQTGFLFKLKPTDYIVGASPLVTPDLIPDGDWREYAPVGELQANMFVFDTLSCATFSALNTIETWVNYHIAKKNITDQQIQTLKDLGFFIDGQFNASDRFTAIMSGTTKQGNYPQNVWDSIRRDGLLPEKDLPFDPSFKKWEEYHDKTKITEEMKTKAKKVLDILEFAYEWITLDVDTTGLIKEALKKAPLQAAIPVPATHAIELIANDFYYDSYDPFIKPLKKKINFSLKPIVTIKKATSVSTYTTVKYGMRGESVKKLQNDLKTLGYFKGVVDGIFGKITLASVKAFQKSNSLVVDGIAGKNTLLKIEELKKKLK